MRIKDFLRMNNLRQRELAEFLNITETAVSNLVSGKAKNFSEENLIKLINNNKGWDTSMLLEPDTPSITQTINSNGSVSGCMNQVGFSGVETREQELLRIIAQQQEQISSLIKVMERLTVKIDN